MNYFVRFSVAAIAVLLLGVVSGCAATEPASEKTASKSEKPVATEKKTSIDIYEVHHDGRINVFYSKELRDEFVALGETSFRLTRIGDGPHGETMVFGLTKKDKKLKHNIPAIDLYDRKIKADEFYGEMHKHGRIYVFDAFEDMKTVRDFGHPNFMYTRIGAGPKGETVVFVLNKHNKKKHPEALIAEFKKRNS